MLRIVLIIVVLFLLLGLLPTWPYSQGWGMGYYPSGGLGLLLIILLVFFLIDRRRI
jgi:prepilin signal peptidase PulO-like enzyme (type II secretory pathway)